MSFFKKVFREVARPFQYASKAGSSQTSQVSRHDIGGNITGANTILQLSNVDTIAPQQFKQHLRNKGLTKQMVDFFAPLEYVIIGKREKKEMIFNQTSASVQIVGVAVYNDGTQMRVAIIKKKCVVTYTSPQTRIEYITRNYGLGWRNQDNHSKTIGRGLNPNELKTIKQALDKESSRHSLAIEAQNTLNL